MVKLYAFSWFLIAVAVAIVAVGNYDGRETGDRFLLIALVAAE